MNTIACASNMLGPMSFGEVLRERREAVGLTRTDLRRICGISREAIGRYERGDSEPNPVMRYALRMALGLPEDADGGWWRTDW